MASVKHLKRDINNVFGDIIDAILYWEYSTENVGKGSELIQEVLASYDEYIEKITDRNTEDRGAHLKAVRKNFEQKAGYFVAKLNELS
ncbi:hypothetical protein [Capnocytophaga sp.]|uniref:hypothetical protein n=1 Tax=Capnocytophaga sp. TaxID=44737 RepID=UPI0026DB4B03|nr:hypothetical protein [Capnocytophaga sp.]MDO5105724.1 hypothetical protein [Capnocytophaga sp.]